MNNPRKYSMTEFQARQKFTAAQVNLEKAFAEFHQARGALKAFIGQVPSMSVELTAAFTQVADGAGKSIQADF